MPFNPYANTSSENDSQLKTCVNYSYVFISCGIRARLVALHDGKRIEELRKTSIIRRDKSQNSRWKCRVEETFAGCKRREERDSREISTSWRSPQWNYWRIANQISNQGWSIG